MMPNKPKSLLGYDTRSRRSALVMAAVDALNPWKRPRPVEWRGRVMISSIAGLGDLFVHLPLISGIVNECRRRHLPVSVALRPPHEEIGRRCGWDVWPFDNGLEDFFKNPGGFRISEFVETIHRVRKTPPDLWIDLTGSAVSAIAIKAAGVKRLAARITRGGKSLVNHPLPHRVQENEYANRQRVAEFLACQVDETLAQRIDVRSGSEQLPCVVLCLTTACRWKNWPLSNFRFLIESFAETRFVLVGFRHEVLPEERHQLEGMLRLANVIDRMDGLSAAQMMDIIAGSDAVVSNDTSAAHIANFFGKPGAVLFGPVSPKTFAAPDGLRVFHDASCPLHPCVQWRCGNEAGWCMRKIRASDVADHLRDVLAGKRRPSTTRLSPEPAHDPAYQPDWQREAQLPV